MWYNYSIKESLFSIYIGGAQLSENENQERIDPKQLARELYEGSDISIRELSEKSLSLVGASLSESLLKQLSANEGWRKTDINIDVTILISLTDMVSSRIKEGGLSVQELARLVEAFDRLIRIKEKLNMLVRVSESAVASHGRTSVLQ